MVVLGVSLAPHARCPWGQLHSPGSPGVPASLGDAPHWAGTWGGPGGATSTGGPGGIGLWQSEGTTQAEPGPGSPCWAGTGTAGLALGHTGQVPSRVSPGHWEAPTPHSHPIPALGEGTKQWLALEAPAGLWRGGAQHWPYGWDRGIGSKCPNWSPLNCPGRQGVGHTGNLGLVMGTAVPWARGHCAPHSCLPQHHPVWATPQKPQGDPALMSKIVQLSAAKAGGDPWEALTHHLPAGFWGENRICPLSQPLPSRTHSLPLPGPHARPEQ